MLRAGVTHPVLLLAVLVTWSLTLLCLGALLGVLVRGVGALSASYDIGGMLLSSMGGTLVSLAFLPHWVRSVAPAPPGYWVASSMRSAFAGDIHGCPVRLPGTGRRRGGLRLDRVDTPPRRRRPASGAVSAAMPVGEPDRHLLLLTLQAKPSRRLQVNDPPQDAGVTTLTATRDTACDDVKLLCRIGRGDETAMAAFYREHGRVVFSQVLLVTGDRVLAEEIVQDTMLAVWRGAGSFRGESSVRSWVIAISRRQTRDRLRGRRLQVVDDAFLAGRPVPGPGPEAMALHRAELAEVTGAIRELAPPHREVLGLVFAGGLSLPEVAGVLEIPLGTVKSRLSAARTALSRALNEKGKNR